MFAADVYQHLADTHSIEGWFFPIDAFLFGFIDQVQKEQNVSGDIFEIGVHHGKSSTLLAKMLQGQEKLRICDVFEQQQENDSHSGSGREDLFRRNIGPYCSTARLEVFVQSSHTIRAEHTTHNCRLFHIDGGHGVNDVINDLDVALNAINDCGVVIVDDVFNATWPEVSEGLYDFLGRNRDCLVPFLIGGNKAYLARPTAVVEHYAPSCLPASIAQYCGDGPYVLAKKRWLGIDVTVAIRKVVVDISPGAAAYLHGMPPIVSRMLAKVGYTQARSRVAWPKPIMHSHK
jgi:hypothetical protein